MSVVSNVKTISYNANKRFGITIVLFKRSSVSPLFPPKLPNSRDCVTPSKVPISNRQPPRVRARERGFVRRTLLRESMESFVVVVVRWRGATRNTCRWCEGKRGLSGAQKRMGFTIRPNRAPVVTS